MSKCQDVLTHIYEYINTHDVTPQLSDEISHHLEVCRACYDRYEFEQQLLQRFKKAGCCSCPDSLKKKIQIILENY